MAGKGGENFLCIQAASSIARDTNKSARSESGVQLVYGQPNNRRIFFQRTSMRLKCNLSIYLVAKKASELPTYYNG